MANREAGPFTQMGGEGGHWIGQAPFCKENHVFQNLGDGTYFHSGLMAIRAACAADVNITYKILYNDAVAMTGGQAVDGPLNPWMISHQVRAEGVKAVAVVADDPGRYGRDAQWAPGTTVHHRRELDTVQRRLRDVPGVTVLIYDQVCAAEKRRRRKRGTLEDPARWALINKDVCEGCGDCGLVSNCVSLTPVDTPFGVKRAVDLSSCNKDFTCLDGFCPSFVTIEGGHRRPASSATGAAADDPAAGLPDPRRPDLGDRDFNILVAGIGGSGVVTVGALLTMAAHLDGLAVTGLDLSGIAQKNGAVTSQIRIAADPQRLHGAAIPSQGADVILGCDLVVTAGAEALPTLNATRTRAVVNSHAVALAAFAIDAEQTVDRDGLCDALRARLPADGLDLIDATGRCTDRMGNALGANVFLAGYTWQKGLLPISLEAIDEAIALNGVAVDANRRAFAWGRRAAHEPDRMAGDGEAAPPPQLADLVAMRADHLAAYQDPAYSRKYRLLVALAEQAEIHKTPGRSGLAAAVAVAFHNLCAYKDEYEVARLLTSDNFTKKINELFDENYVIHYHMAPPFLDQKQAGRPRKRAFGPWLRPVLSGLARCKKLRGTKWDPFGRTAERRAERQRINDYTDLVEEVMTGLAPDNHDLAVDLLSIAGTIKGFGPVKAAAVAAAETRERDLRAAFRAVAKVGV